MIAPPTTPRPARHFRRSADHHPPCRSQWRSCPGPQPVLAAARGPPTLPGSTRMICASPAASRRRSRILTPIRAPSSSPPPQPNCSRRGAYPPGRRPPAHAGDHRLAAPHPEPGLVWSTVMFRADAARLLDPFERAQVRFTPRISTSTTGSAAGQIARLDEALFSLSPPPRRRLRNAMPRWRAPRASLPDAIPACSRPARCRPMPSSWCWLHGASWCSISAR